MGCMGTSQYVLGFGFWIRSDRNTVPRAEAEKRGEGHADAARSWRGTGQLHDEATAPWVIRSCVHTPLTADERAADAKQRATTAAAFLDSLRHSSVEEGAAALPVLGEARWLHLLRTLLPRG